MSAPPIGIAVWRMPSTKPRSPRSNQPMIARPLAPVALPPKKPAKNSATSRSVNVSASAAPTSAPTVPSRPTVSTGRSPVRSASTPHGSRPAVMPAAIAANTKPVSRDRQRERVAELRAERRHALAQRADDHRAQAADDEDDPAVAHPLVGAHAVTSRRRARWRRALAALPHVCIEHQRRLPAGERS